MKKLQVLFSVSEPGQQLHSQSSPGDLAVAEGQTNGKFSLNGKFGQNGKLGNSCIGGTKGRHCNSRVSDHAIVHLGLNVSSSAHDCGGVIDGGNAIAAI